MTTNRKKWLAVVLPLIAATCCFSMLLVESRNRVLRHWVDDVLYDNYNHYLPCEKLPTEDEVRAVLDEHKETVKRILLVSQGFVGVEVDTPCPGRADIIFWYGSHSQRLEIEAIIGGRDFFGVPYRLSNR